MQHSSPSNPILDHMKRAARNLLHGLQERDSTALRRYYSIDPLARMDEPRQDDARYIVARGHGYSSWRKLAAHATQASSFHG
jgi:hypothetical protein